MALRTRSTDSSVVADCRSHYPKYQVAPRRAAGKQCAWRIDIVGRRGRLAAFGERMTMVIALN